MIIGQTTRENILFFIYFISYMDSFIMEAES